MTLAHGTDRLESARLNFPSILVPAPREAPRARWPGEPGSRRESDRPARGWRLPPARAAANTDRKSTRLNSSHSQISYAVFCLKKKKPNLQNARIEDLTHSAESDATTRTLLSHCHPH